MLFHSRIYICFFATALSLTACHPNYPKCDMDEDCHGRGEVCIHGMCQECRDDAQCDLKYPGEKHSCIQGRCEASDVAVECHLDVDCHARGEALLCRDNKCVPECRADKECGEGRRCASQRCVAACAGDADCPDGQACLNGQCQTAQRAREHVSSECLPLSTLLGEVIRLDLVTFEFNQYDLTPETQEKLTRAVSCLKQAPPALQVVVEGHCDERGTQEYNLALGERRAQSVYRYFQSQGIEESRLILRSKGENEPLCNEATEACYSQNRRVQFIQQLGAPVASP